MKDPQEDDPLQTLQAQLEGDLWTLFRLTFTNGPVTDGDVRAASVILRKWLCDGLIGRLTNLLDVQATVPVIENDAMIAALSHQPSIDYFLTGGVKFRGTPISAMYHSSMPSQPTPLLPFALSDKMVSIKNMLAQRRVFYKGDYFTCDDIISFTANKLGGAHLDFSRSSKHQKMAEASDFMTFGGPLANLRRPPPGPLYIPLEPNGHEILSGFHVEIGAAAASFCHLHLNGQMLLDITSLLRPTIVGRLKRLFGLAPKAHGQTTDLETGAVRLHSIKKTP